jgi:hypothetical protein
MGIDEAWRRSNEAKEMRARHQGENGGATYNNRELQKCPLYVQEDRRYLQGELTQQLSRRHLPQAAWEQEQL